MRDDRKVWEEYRQMRTLHACCRLAYEVLAAASCAGGAALDSFSGERGRGFQASLRAGQRAAKRTPSTVARPAKIGAVLQLLLPALPQTKPTADQWHSLRVMYVLVHKFTPFLLFNLHICTLAEDPEIPRTRAKLYNYPSF